MMRQSYRDYVRDNTGTFRQLMTHLLEDHAPLVIHCYAGVSRSPAAAYVAACALAPHRCEMELAQALRLPDGTRLDARPIRPEDSQLELEFVKTCEAIRLIPP